MNVYPTNRKMPFKCEMCGEYQLKKPAFIWVPLTQNLTGSEAKRVCRKCAIREHGRKNKHKLTDIPKIKDKNDG